MLYYIFLWRDCGWWWEWFNEDYLNYVVDVIYDVIFIDIEFWSVFFYMWKLFEGLW